MINKNKLRFGIKEFFRPTPEKVQKLIIKIQAILALPVVVTMWADKPWWAIALMVLGLILDLASRFVGEHPEIFAVEEAEAVLKEKVAEVAQEIKQEQIQKEDAKL